MKPISLTVAGLHSFRERQVIDFEALCQGGVFGIFGPTGSGKSSILDAMTLALYGKVERASNNTQGIMNHAENVLDVSYVFELENSKGKQRFKVERTFKRTDDIRVKSGICRLSEIRDDEHLVIADKSGDVNQAVQEILGLTIDDFTRAVVLPQGKFAEFLSLKGADRRQMLQRLFQLEKYGDELSRKIKEELHGKTRLLGEIQAEQLGLGEASDEAVKTAEEAYKELDQAVKSSEKALQEMESLFEEKKKKWEWQSERGKVEFSLKRMMENESHIKKLEEKVSLAQQASALKPLLEDLMEVEGALEKWQHQFEEDTIKHSTAKELLQKAVETYEASRKKKELQHPELLRQKERLARAKTLEDGLIPLKTELKKLEEELELKNEKLNKEGLLETRTREIHQKALAKQKSLKAELTDLSLSAKKLEELQHAFEKKQEITQVQRKLKDTNEETQKLFEKLQHYQKDNSRAQNELQEGKKGLLAFFRSTEKHYAACSRLTVELDWMGHQVEKFLQDEKNLEDELKIHQIAMELAKSLEEGEACPVCGSTHHPSRPDQESMKEIASSKEENGVEALIPSIQTEKQKNVTVKLKLEQMASELYQELEGAYSLPDPAPSIEQVEEWEKEYRDTAEPAELLLKKFHKIQTEQKGLQQDLIHFQERKAQLDLSLRKSSQDVSETYKLMQTFEEQWAGWNQRLEELRNINAELCTSWTEHFPDLKLETIEADFKAAKEVEKQMKVLQERINTSVEFIEEKERELRTVQERKQEMEKLVFQEDLIKKQLQNRIEETNGEIKAVVGDLSILHELKQVEESLLKLNELEENAYKDWTSAQNDYHERDKKVKQSEQMVAETSSRKETLFDKWRLALEKSTFTSKNEVEEAVIFLENMDQWSKETKSYWDERNMLEKDKKRLDALIGEASISETEWIDIQENVQDKRKMLRMEIEAKSAAQHHLSTVKERNERYRVLEDKKEQLSDEIGSYQKLQAIFKGNSFVEYLAEEQLHQISRDASERLGHLTRQRYALEMDSQGGFIIRDDANGGVRRPVSSLSGGETFLTSLALALSLSAQIQLRGEYPLQFFFLDEGFGTLDSELLDAVVTALEKLQSNHLAVGVISHVQELRARLPRRLVVTPARSEGTGSVVTFENL
ncbi:exonuclease SbcC [Bacillus tianshenii]|uniref:Nuclease SbcCD subunit C n=1 Tax=Sutcliffiella tianshenii TaxID=1463404 RepID=A0ABS2P193_9BACI|nr:SMC family ATPase [Bacillus tianshenii]MBM7620703.1 exonuclease SbcC [Bacillus tianshenii]